MTRSTVGFACVAKQKTCRTAHGKREISTCNSGASKIDEVMKSLKEKCDASSHLKCGGHALCYGHTFALDVPRMNCEGPSRFDCDSDSDDTNYY